MGNKLCAPLLKKSYRQEDYPWHMRKDSHLLRLWAEVFRVHGDGEYMRWERVSEDVVPVNISCIQDSPDTMFQVTAYNRHVEKIFDVKIVQPGTIICPATETFVHWRDMMDTCEWGLNFTTPTDAKRFRDCCMNPAQKFSRKANSASSLRLSPPKRIRGQESSISSPSSPTHQQNQVPRRAVSNPHTLVTSDVHHHHHHHHHGEDPGAEGRKEKAATIPRTQAEQEQDLESQIKPIGILKPPSTTSVYDNVTGNGVQLRKGSYHGNENRNARKSMPPMSSSHVSFVEKNLLDDVRPASAIHFTRQFVQKEADDFDDVFQRRPEQTTLVTFKGNVDQNQRERRSSSRTSDNVRIETAFVGEDTSSQSGQEVVKNESRVSYIETSTRVLAPKPVKKNPSVAESKKSSSSESPEWPSPPEPLTPMTPVNPDCHVDFDSDALKRMLQSLPVSPDDSNVEGEQDKIRVTRAKSLSSHENSNKENRKAVVEMCKSTSAIVPKSQSTQNVVESTNNTAGIVHIRESSSASGKSKSRMSIEEELRLRNKCARDSYGQESYPDSGIGGMTADVAGSVCSGGSSKAHRSTGFDVNSSRTGTGSTGGSSRGSSSSGHHSDLINQLGENGDVKQFLTSELSDDDAESDDSIHTMTEAESQVSFTKQFGAIRKAGWLVVKNWLIHRKRKLELAPRRKWKQYWVCLKGTVLLFFEGGEEAVISETSIPRHILVIEGGIAQAVPEHPKRENIFSLSTAFGDAYLFQASSATELEGWISVIHSACASSFARQHGKDNTLKLMKNELHKLETNIDVDVKMRKMAELQLTVVTDPRSRQAIIKQINQWEENLEKLFVEQYRLRCYIASLQGTELPNPKVLLGNVSKATKSTLSRLGIFTVTSFHALVAARKPLVVPNIYGKGHHKGGMLSPRGDGTFKYSLKPKSGSSPVKSPSSEAIYKATDIDEVVADLYMDSPDDISGNSVSDGSSIVETLSRIALPNNQTILVGVDKRTSVQDLLESVCSKRQLNPCDHYVRIKLPNTPPGNYTIPDSRENIKRLKYESIEVCQKSVFQLQLLKTASDSEFGFAVEAELAEDYDRDDDLRLYVSNVIAGGVAQRSGLSIGDEILVINGQIVSELDVVYIEEVLHKSRNLCLTVRSLRTHFASQSVKTEASGIDTMVCPPPPTQSRIPEKVIGDLTVPAPQVNFWEDHPESATEIENSKQSMDQQSPCDADSQTDQPSSQIDSLLQGADQVTSICRRGSDPEDVNGQIIPSSKPLSEAQKLRKVIMELIETERAYVKDLNCLTERYLEPLKEETFLTSDEIDQLFGNIQEIVQFQRQFLQSLEEAMHLDNDFFTTEDSKSFRRILFSLGGSFLYYANHFKVYSSFCASHTRSQKILNPVANEALKAFLGARNPKQQHSATLDSYLIKPIQRILKYPLLLQQLCNLTDIDTDEHYHLSEALKGMEAVAEHINEMQKIFEEYGTVFDDLSKMFRDLYPHKKPIDLSVGELQMYGTVEWCNMCDILGKVKKGLDLENIVFVFKTGVVFVCRERVKKKIKPKDRSSKTQTEVYECQEKFRTVIPVQEVQVQVGKVSDMDRHYWWDLVHCRSDKEGRPERLYQFCNSSAEAKQDFMKIIRQTIRESVRKMTLPNGGSQPLRKGYVPYGGKRISNLQGSNLRTLSKKRGGKSVEEDGTERHSMDFEEKVTLLVEAEPSMRTRSRTVGDLNDATLEIPENDPVSNITHSTPHLSPERKSSCSSSSNLSTSSRNSASARLTQASTNPLTFSSTSVNTNDSPCSPVWKPRNESNMVHIEGNHLAAPPNAGGPSNASHKSNVDCSDIVFKRNSKTIVLQQPHNSVQLKDTEC